MTGEAVFIGYRRDDTADVAGRVHEHFARRFGKDRIFMDVDNLRPGADFGEYIKSVLPRCRVALILIGPHWLEVKDEHGTRRLDDLNDWVRIEIETALATPDLDVVPVLVNGARMPRAEELPASLQPLLRRHAAIIRRNPDFGDDVGKLINALRASVNTGILDLSKIGGKASVSSAPAQQLHAGSKTPLLVGGVIAVVLAVSAWALWRNLPPPVTTNTTTDVSNGSVSAGMQSSTPSVGTGHTNAPSSASAIRGSRAISTPAELLLAVQGRWCSPGGTFQLVETINGPWLVEQSHSPTIPLADPISDARLRILSNDGEVITTTQVLADGEDYGGVVSYKVSSGILERTTGNVGERFNRCTTAAR